MMMMMMIKNKTYIYFVFKVCFVINNMYNIWISDITELEKEVSGWSIAAIKNMIHFKRIVLLITWCYISSTYSSYKSCRNAYMVTSWLSRTV